MSPDVLELPPADAPFAEKLRLAMALSTDYKSQRKLGAALGTDGSLVGKWLRGVSPQPRYRDALERVLPVPAGYFQATSRDRLEELAGDVRDLLSVVADMATRLERLESGRGHPRAAPKRQGRKR